TVGQGSSSDAAKLHSNSGRFGRSRRKPPPRRVRTSLGGATLPLVEYRFAFCDGRQRPAHLPSLPELWPQDSSARLSECSCVPDSGRLARRSTAMAHDVRLDLRGHRHFLFWV